MGAGAGAQRHTAVQREARGFFCSIKYEPAGEWPGLHSYSGLSRPDNARICRAAEVLRRVYGLVAAAMRWWLKPMSEGWVSAARAANRMCSRRAGSAHSWRSGQPGPSTP